MRKLITQSIRPLNLFSLFFRMVRPGCPVILLQLFSIFIRTGGMVPIMDYVILYIK